MFLKLIILISSVAILVACQDNQVTVIEDSTNSIALDTDTAKETTVKSKVFDGVATDNSNQSHAGELLD